MLSLKYKRRERIIKVILANSSKASIGDVAKLIKYWSK
jgi:hypothetical protein